MDEFSLPSLITEFGFPIFLVVYLLYREGKRLDKIAQSINEFRIGLYLVLSRLNVVDEYREAVKKFRGTGDREET